MLLAKLGHQFRLAVVHEKGKQGVLLEGKVGRDFDLDGRREIVQKPAHIRVVGGGRSVKTVTRQRRVQTLKQGEHGDMLLVQHARDLTMGLLHQILHTGRRGDSDWPRERDPDRLGAVASAWAQAEDG